MRASNLRAYARRDLARMTMRHEVGSVQIPGWVRRVVSCRTVPYVYVYVYVCVCACAYAYAYAYVYVYVDVYVDVYVYVYEYVCLCMSIYFYVCLYCSSVSCFLGKVDSSSNSYGFTSLPQCIGIKMDKIC